MNLTFAATLLLITAAPCAHRGDVAHAPENTLPAFALAVEKGAPMIEFDVHLSKDGRMVIIHDDTVDRTTDGTGKVSDLTFDELRALDAGSWFDEKFKGTRIPTLRETLEAIPPHVLCNVHLKYADGVAPLAAALIKEMGRLDQCFLACDLDQAETAKAVVPEIKICNMSRQSGDRDAYADSTIAAGAAFIQVQKGKGLDGLTDQVARLHAAGVTVNYFGTEDPAEINVLADAGVDFILTDDLELCQKTLAERAETTAAARGE